MLAYVILSALSSVPLSFTPDDQAWEALEEVGRKHDAEYGISWTTLECMADILFGHAPETHDVEEKQP